MTKEAKIYTGEMTVSSSGVGKTGQIHAKKKLKLDHSLTSYRKILKVG